MRYVRPTRGAQRWRFGLLASLTCALLPCWVASASGFDPAYEARNYNKINERAASDYTPQFNAALAQQGLINEQQGLGIVTADGPQRQYGRDFSGNLCAHHMNGCAGDIRLYDWGAAGRGIVRPILFTARNGSTLSGHVWMTLAGPAHRPGVVITNGSVQAPEPLYWFAAETLAKAGYVVMTWDPQGQGYSDTYGQGNDRNDGVPSQSGEPFFDGTEDALDFFYSTPANPYLARKSCSSGTSHGDKQITRVTDGRSSAYNPLFGSLDGAHVGLVGHSLGAAAVSYIGQLDPRVSAIFAYDNLNDVSSPAGTSYGGQGLACPSGASPRPPTVPISKPAFGMAADYSLTPMPYAADPPPQNKSMGSLAASRARVDTGQIIVRGGTHYEFSYIPNPGFGATHRGMDMASWYTTAFLDKELKADPTADPRLLTTRWRNDRLEAGVDDQLPPDPNLYSTYYRSRLDIRRPDGGRFTCEDLRNGCLGQTSGDGRPPDYSFLAAANTPDSAATPGSTTAPAGAPGVPPAATGTEALNAIAAAGGRLGGSGHGGAAACSTAGHPRSHIARARLLGRRARRLRISGRAGSGRCEPVVRVLVAIGRARGRHCRFLGASGRYGPITSCRRTSYLTATGTTRWRLKLTGRLGPGRYKIWSRAVDARGAVEPKRRAGNFRRVRIP